MVKALGLAFVFALALAMPVAAEQTVGTVSWVDVTNQSIVLDDGTRLWVSDGQANGLSRGDRVQAAYEMKGDRKVVTQMARQPLGLDGITSDPLNSIQAGDN